jgi:predicted lipid-binding transport protein (Tim44 family)
MRRRPAAFFAAFAVVALALAPALSEARPGGSSSSGSRGSRTYTAPPTTQTAPGGAQQMQRTQTPPSTPAQTAGAASAARPAGAAAAQGSFFSRNPMMAGLMGGLLGAGLFGLLSGSGLFGGMAGFMGFLGLMLQIALIGGLVYLAVRLIRGRRQPAMAGGAPNAYAREMQPAAPVRPMGGGGAAPVATRPVQVEEADFNAFAETLVAVNAAWSRQDLTALRRLSTPEMTNFFADDLNALRARGWTNTTADVRLEQGDLSEAWHENGEDYATVAMRFSLIDVTRAADGTVTEGSPTERQMTTELWTFVRRQGSPWMLSAIQQTG